MSNSKIDFVSYLTKDQKLEIAAKLLETRSRLVKELEELDQAIRELNPPAKKLAPVEKSGAGVIRKKKRGKQVIEFRGLSDDVVKFFEEHPGESFSYKLVGIGVASKRGLKIDSPVRRRMIKSVGAILSGYPKKNWTMIRREGEVSVYTLTSAIPSPDQIS